MDEMHPVCPDHVKGITTELNVDSVLALMDSNNRNTEDKVTLEAVLVKACAYATKLVRSVCYYRENGRIIDNMGINIRYDVNDGNRIFEAFIPKADCESIRSINHLITVENTAHEHYGLRVLHHSMEDLPTITDILFSPTSGMVSFTKPSKKVIFQPVIGTRTSWRTEENIIEATFIFDTRHTYTTDVKAWFRHLRDFLKSSNIPFGEN